jgi:hypothetical protein
MVEAMLTLTIHIEHGERLACVAEVVVLYR